MSPSPQLTKQAPIKEADKEGDDWVGLSDPAERRRRQNRINQRARRRRQRSQANQDIHPKSVVSSTSSSSATAIVRSKDSITLKDDSDSNRCLKNGFLRALMDRFASTAIESYIKGSPTSDHLLTLTKVNVFRAFGNNLLMAGGSFDNMDDDSISHFNTAAPQHNALVETSMPLSLRPTRVQKTIPHHPWLDFFPLPRMRDNMIQAGDTWDDEQLCVDIMGFWNTGSAENSGLLVWGEPWDINNWEVTEAFLKKWSWIVRGCPELMISTNKWRAKRGEKLIFRYI